MSATVQTAQQRQKRSIAGAFVGTAIEWYDFFSFGTAAALVFGTVFYPDLAQGSGLLASFATFWVGFLARPIGGLIFSHFGDKFGRKNTLIVTLLMMGIATTCIGFLPTYGQIGVAAPILLIVLRAVQGLAVGGEWGGAVVLATENSTAEKRGFAGAWVQQGSPAGSILSTVAFILVGLLPDDQFMSWGWRIPFLFSAVLVIVALVIRARVEESQEFTAAKAQGEPPKVPVVEAFNVAGIFIFFGVLASIVGIASAYFNNTFMLSWTTGILGMDRTFILNLILLSAVVQFFWQPMAAKLSEKFGIRSILIWGLLLNLIVTPPLFLAIQTTNELFLAITIVISTIGATAYYAMLATALSDAFPTRVRYTGVSMAYQLCATIFGGSTPIIAQWLLNSTGNNPWSVMTFSIIQILLSLIGVIGLYRTRAKTQSEETQV